MKTNFLKPIIGGMLLGAFIFFTGPLLLIVLLLKFIFTPFGMGRMMMYKGFKHDGFKQHRFAFADKKRSMNEEEYNAFKTKFQNNQFINGCNKNC